MYEEVFRGTPRAALEHFTQPRGEFTLVIEGGAATSSEAAPATAPDAQKRLKALLAEGVAPNEAVARVVRETGLRRRDGSHAQRHALDTPRARLQSRCRQTAKM